MITSRHCSFVMFSKQTILTRTHFDMLPPTHPFYRLYKSIYARQEQSEQQADMTSTVAAQSGTFQSSFILPEFPLLLYRKKEQEKQYLIIRAHSYIKGQQHQINPVNELTNLWLNHKQNLQCRGISRKYSHDSIHINASLHFAQIQNINASA